MPEPLDRLRILQVTRTLPYPPNEGSRWLLYNTLSALGARHDIVLLARASQDTTPERLKELRIASRIQDVLLFDTDWRGDWTLQSYVSDARFRASLSSRNLQRLLLSVWDDADVIQAESLDVAYNVLQALNALSTGRRPAVILRLHNLMSAYYTQYPARTRPATRMGRRVPAWLRKAMLGRRVDQYRRLERDIFSAADALVVLSEEDEHLARAMTPTATVSRIYMGIDLRAKPMLSPNPPSGADPLTLTFVGTFSWPPNGDGAITLVRDILPHLHDLPLRTLIVGRDPPAEVRRWHDGSRVCVLGYVPDIEAVWRETHIAAVPVRFGTGVNTKTIDALAHGIPVVTFARGRQGVAGRDAVHFLEARTVEEFAAQIRRLASDQDLYRRLSVQGRELVEQYHSLDAMGSQLERLYRQTISTRPRPTPPTLAHSTVPGTGSAPL